MPSDKRFAVLIDADNVSEKYIKGILREVAKDGISTYKRIYGDWTKPSFSSWKTSLLENSITPIQQYSYTTGKNATDSAMIIDAMDILYSGDIEGFCIVSSDSDFTRLASRLRESGKYVVGMGEKKTPSPFIAACDRFIYLEVTIDGQNISTSQGLETIRGEISHIVKEISDDDGWASLSAVGNLLRKRHPDFDVRNYGFAKLTLFIESLKGFVFKSEGSVDGAKAVFIRLSSADSPAFLQNQHPKKKIQSYKKSYKKN